MTGFRIYRDDNADGVADPLVDGLEKDLYPGTGDGTNPLDSGLVPTVTVSSWDSVGLATGTIYGFKVRAYNARGYSTSAWSYIKAAAEPNQITTLDQNIGGGSETSIALTWTVPSTNGGTIVGYKVYRDAGSGTDFLSAPDPTCGMEQNPAPQACTITGLTTGDNYQIRILTTNEVGDGALSPVVTYKAATFPAQIAQPINTEAAYTPKLTYTWTSPRAQGSAIFAYEAQLKRLDLNGEPAAWTSGGTAANPVIPLTVTFEGNNDHGLASERQHAFRVRAVNGMGQGLWSEWASLTDAPRGWTLNAPSTPLNFGRHPDTPVAGFVKVSWTAITDNALAGYDDFANVIYEVYAGAVEPTLRGETDQNFFEQAVPSGETWKFKVRAKNTGGQVSAFTDAYEGGRRLVSGRLPSVVPTLVLTSNTAGIVHLTWSVPTDNGGTPITEYQITNNGFTSYTAIDNYYTSTSWANQAAGATVSYSVRAVNAVGAGPEITDSITVSR
jgi:hypothetical protein